MAITIHLSLHHSHHHPSVTTSQLSPPSVTTPQLSPPSCHLTTTIITICHYTTTIFTIFHYTTTKAFDEMMKKDEGVPTPDANAKMTSEVVNSSSVCWCSRSFCSCYERELLTLVSRVHISFILANL